MQYLLVFLVSMVPLIELRLAVPMAIGMGLAPIPSIIVCAIGNLLPVPVIYLFARRFLIWGAKQKYIGRFCGFCLEKGERAGQKLVARTGRGGLFAALVLFVGVPVPGTGAWTGTLAASFLDMGIKSTVTAVLLGIVMAALIMALASTGVVGVLGM